MIGKRIKAAAKPSAIITNYSVINLLVLYENIIRGLRAS